MASDARRRTINVTNYGYRVHSAEAVGTLTVRTGVYIIPAIIPVRGVM